MAENAPAFHRHTRPAEVAKLVAAARIGDVENTAIQHMHFTAIREIQIRIPHRNRPRIQQHTAEIRIPARDGKHALIPHRPSQCRIARKSARPRQRHQRRARQRASAQVQMRDGRVQRHAQRAALHLQHIIANHIQRVHRERSTINQHRRRARVIDRHIVPHTRHRAAAPISRHVPVPARGSRP